MTHTRISIIIPIRNEAACLHESLARLQGFRRQGHEIILVDGGSTDGGPDMAAGLVDACLGSEAGRALQMNAGARVATGTILWFLHIDTHVPADGIARIVAGLAQTGRAWGRFDVRLAPAGPLLHLVAWMMNRRSRLTGIATGDQGIFVNRRLFETVGGYPEIPLMEDVALCKRLKRWSRPCCLPSRLVTSSRRWQTRGTLRTIALMWWLRLAYVLGVSPSRLAAWYR